MFVGSSSLEETNNMKLLYFIMALLLVIPSFGQREATYYEEKHPSHRLTFYNRGEYREYYNCYKGPWGIACNYCRPISNGTYIIQKGNYVLTSDEAIPCIKDTITYKLSEPIPNNNDSATFIIRSPYEELFEEEDNCTICTYPHDRVYLYHFSVICANDSISRRFESEFNKAQKPTFSNICKIMIPPEVRIEAVHLEMTWGDTTYLWQDPDVKCSTTIQLPYPPSSHMLYTVTLPKFDYFYLAHKKYQKESTRKRRESKGGEERFFFNGQVFQKLNY